MKHLVREIRIMVSIKATSMAQAKAEMRCMASRIDSAETTKNMNCHGGMGGPTGASMHQVIAITMFEVEKVKEALPFDLLM